MMESPPFGPFNFPPTPGMPLFSLSPERINAQRGNATPTEGLPTSLPEFGSPKHARSNSAVEGMIARFGSLDVKDHVDLRKKDEAALRRAQMGREEAEGEARKLKDEARVAKKEAEDAKERERKTVKKLDVLLVSIIVTSASTLWLTWSAGGTPTRQGDADTRTDTL